MDVVAEKILKQIRNPAPGAKLLHERNKRVCQRGNAFYYSDLDETYHILSGLLPVLKLIYWPDFEMKEIIKKPKTYQSRKGTRRKKDQQFPILIQKTQKEKKRGRYYGLIRGTEVHQELRDFIEMDERSFRKKYPVIHEYTRRILLFISAMKWIPFIAEFNVFDEQLRIGTSIDMVCLCRATGKVIFLEFKTGYKDYFNNFTSYMHHSMNKLTNSPYHQAHLQLICSVLLVMKHHRIRDDEFEMYVVRIDETGLNPHKISNQFLSINATAIYKDLHQHRTGEIVL